MFSHAVRTAGAFAVLLAACGGETGPKHIEKGTVEAAATYPVRDILVRWDVPAPPPKPPPTGKKRAPPPPPPPKTYGRTKEQALARAKEAAAKAKAGPGAFEATAREMTDDEVAKQDDGFVGFVSIDGNYTATLVEAAAASPIGQVMDPLKGDGGWHVMQVLSREEGKRLEANLTAIVDGLLVPWQEVAPSIDPLITRDAAYAKAAKVVSALRAGGELVPLMGTVDAGRPFMGALRRSTRPGFEAVAAASLLLKPDGSDWSDPLPTPQGWAIVHRRPYLRARVRQIAIGFSRQQPPPGTTPDARDPKQRTVEQALKIAQEAHERAKADPAAWDDLVREYSDEPDTKARGGLLGDVTNADPAGPQTFEEIKDAVERLKPGEMSPPVKSRIAYHILRRDD